MTTRTSSHSATTEVGADIRRDEEIAQQIRTHHSAMVDELDRLTAALQDAPVSAREETRDRLAEWFDDVLVPHADEEEQTIYRAAGELSEGTLLIEAMVREHTLIKRLVALFNASDDAVAAAYGRAAYETFKSHQDKENEVILPLLVGAAHTRLADAVGAAHGHHAGHDHHHH